MTTRYVYSLALFFWCPLVLCAQHTNRQKVVLFFKNYQIDRVQKALSNLPASVTKEVFAKEYTYLVDGKNTLPATSFSDRSDYIDSILRYNYMGDYYARRLASNEGLSFGQYRKALAISKMHKDTLLINESLRRINKMFLKNFKGKQLYQKYIDLIPSYQQDQIDNFWKQYYKLVYDMSYMPLDQEPVFTALEKRYLSLAKTVPDHPYFIGLLHHMIGVFYTYSDNSSALSDKHYRIAMRTYNTTHYYSYSRKIRTELAMDIELYEKGKYNVAIARLQQSLDNNQVFGDIELRGLVYEWLSKSYKKLNKLDSALLYQEKMMDAKAQLKSYQLAIRNSDTDVKYETKAKEVKIDKLIKMRDQLLQYFYMLLPILGGALMLLVIVGYLYKRYHKKSTLLEEEQSETLQKLEELKNIVVKNHIVLKDKTKVYISDLIYIKSEDHYLQIYTMNTRTHMVRGKLSQIKEELPPNFIQCHRSYIVNTNFIKKKHSNTLELLHKDDNNKPINIPVSRSYKDQL